MKNNFELREKYSKKIYNLTTYVTYHQYRKSLNRLNWLMKVILLLAFFAILVPGDYGFLLINFVFLGMIIYTFFYFGVNRKARWLRSDSKKVMADLAFKGYIPQSWHVYDGIYKKNEEDENEFSLELVFTQEHTYIENLYSFIEKKGKTLPPDKEDLDILKHYITKLNENTAEYQFTIYATMSPDLYKVLKERGFVLTALGKKYTTKPTRLDYSVAAGLGFKGITHYPKFEAYQIEIG